MKICTDSKDVKSRLKSYKPKFSGRKIPPDPSFDNTLLLEYFNKAISDPDDIQKAHHLLMAADEIAKEMGVVNISVCQSGCAYCCKIPVDVSQIEAELISNYTNKNRNDYSNLKKVNNKYSYCPFLDTQKATCSIYTVRPLACRCFFTLDHYKYCAQTHTEHLIVKVGSNSKWLQINNMLLSLSQNKVADIKEWF